MVSRTEWAVRPRRESLRKRLGLTAHRIEARDHFRCLYCKRTAAESGAHLHIDHLIPRKQGGPDLPTNLVMACRSCNSSRQQMPVRDWAKLRQIPARMIWAQARRSLPTIEEVRAARGGLTVIQGGRKAASPAGHAGGGKGGFELMRCIAPASAGAGEKLCGKTAREEALVDGVYCPLCPGHAAELAREDAEARGESAPMAVAASPRKMTKAKRAWQPRSPREIARIDVAVQEAIESPRCPNCGNTAVVRGSARHDDEEFGCGRCGQRWEPASCFDDVDPIASCKRMTAR